MSQRCVQACVVDLDNDSCFDGKDAVSSKRGAAVRARFRRFCTLEEYLPPSIVLSIRGHFPSILGRRVRRLRSPGAQKRVILSRGADYRAALKLQGNPDPRRVAQVRGGDAAVESQAYKRQRSF